MKSKNGNTVLQSVLENIDYVVTKILIDFGAHVKSKNSIYRIPLHLTMARNNLRINNCLLSHGANVIGLCRNCSFTFGGVMQL